jgi:hypothetical protein
VSTFRAVPEGFCKVPHEDALTALHLRQLGTGIRHVTKVRSQFGFGHVALAKHWCPATGFKSHEAASQTRPTDVCVAALAIAEYGSDVATRDTELIGRLDELPLRIPIGDLARTLLAARRQAPDDVPFQGPTDE